MPFVVCLECNQGFNVKEKSWKWKPEDGVCNSCKEKVKNGTMKKSKNVFTGQEMW